MSIYKSERYLRTRKPLVQTPASRNTDGYGSLDAEERINKNGNRARDQRAVLRAFIKHPGATTKEVSVLEGLDRHMVGKRTPELAEVYLHRMKPPAGTPKGQRELRWMPTELGKKIALTMKKDD